VARGDDAAADAKAVRHRILEAWPVRSVAIGMVGFLFLLSGAGTYFLLRPSPPAAPPPALAPVKAPPIEEAELFPILPETDPPPGLPIVTFGKRGHFKVIRKPQYVSAEEGDRLLFAGEPVLGLVHNGQTRAYSTNQLNDHEMVIDEIGGTPVLVTY
jgi:Protein of unknown function (DUF3179)